MPIPLVKRDGKWAFDGEAGVDEMIYRRVGANELGAIAVSRGLVDAQVIKPALAQWPWMQDSLRLL